MASKNKLKNLQGVEKMQRLHLIDVSCNFIQTLEDIQFARKASFLNDFANGGNPLEQVHTNTEKSCLQVDDSKILHIMRFGSCN